MCWRTWEGRCHCDLCVTTGPCVQPSSEATAQLHPVEAAQALGISCLLLQAQGLLRLLLQCAQGTCPSLLAGRLSIFPGHRLQGRVSLCKAGSLPGLLRWASSALLWTACMSGRISQALGQQIPWVRDSCGHLPHPENSG